MARTDDRWRLSARRLVRWFGRVVGAPYRILVGNGYKTWRAAIWAALLIVIGAAVFSAAYDDGRLEPVDPVDDHQPFQPVVYSMDTLLPIIDLHQESSFEATAAGADGVRIYLWFQIIAGWVLATCLAGAAASALQRPAPGVTPL
jgi:hypothetical protein